MAKTTYIRKTEALRTVEPINYKFSFKCKRKTGCFYVEDFKDGIVTIEPSAGEYLLEFARVIVGCFNKESNFDKEVFKAFNCDKKATITGIKFWFNGVPVLVTREKLDVNQILNEWRLGCKARN